MRACMVAHDRTTVQKQEISSPVRNDVGEDGQEVVGAHVRYVLKLMHKGIDLAVLAVHVCLRTYPWSLPVLVARVRVHIIH